MSEETPREEAWSGWYRSWKSAATDGVFGQVDGGLLVDAMNVLFICKFGGGRLVAVGGTL